MADTEYTVFGTAIGGVGLAWRGGELVAVQLPEASEAATVLLLQKKAPSSPGVPSQPVRDAIAAMQAHLRGAPAELATLSLCWDGLSPFAREVMARARLIPRGGTSTYGELARLVGSPGAARAVGRVMARNPLPLVVPCHRVFGAGGRPVGFSAAGGVSMKLRLLAIERGASSDSLESLPTTLARRGIH